MQDIEGKSARIQQPKEAKKGITKGTKKRTKPVEERERQEAGRDTTKGLEDRSSQKGRGSCSGDRRIGSRPESEAGERAEKPKKVGAEIADRVHGPPARMSSNRRHILEACTPLSSAAAAAARSRACARD